MQRIGILRSGLLFMALLFGLSSAYSAAPKPPIEFNAKVMTSPTEAWVVLSWFAARDGDKATSFEIYQAAGLTEDMAKFDKIATVKATDGDPSNTGRYAYEVLGLKEGKYTFFVKAVNDDGSSDRTVIKVVVIEGKQDRILIVSEPVKTGFKDVLYEYNAKAETNIDGLIMFELVHGPDGLTCSDGGKVRWTPTKAGRYEVSIKASILGTTLFAKQSWVIEVKDHKDTTGNGKGDHCAWISGKVTVEKDGKTETAGSGKVSAWRVDRKADDNGNTTEKWSPVYSAKLVQGSYSLNVAAGTYKLVVEGEDFYAEWNVDAETADDAEQITIECDKRYEVHFTVKGKAKAAMFVVSGTVTDEETGEPIKGKVIFEMTDRNEKQDSRYRVIIAETNADGYYRVELPEGYRYIAVAQAHGRDNQKSPYLPEYWEETADVTLATTISVTENTDGINFTLAKRQDHKNGFGGQLIGKSDAATGATVGVVGKVTAYLLVKHGKSDKPEVGKEVAATVETDAEGNYTFENLEPGTYIIFGMPAERPYAPGWYVAGGDAASSWKDATRIEVADVMITMQHDIMLKKGNGERGKGQMRGWIYRRGGTISKNTDETQGSAVIPGAYVLVVDSKGDIVDYALTDSDGLFDIPTMGIGTQTVIADRIGFEPSTRNVTFVAGGTAQQEVSLELAAAVTSVEIPGDLSMTSYNLYPNPATTVATVLFPSTIGTAEMTILSASGTVVATQTLNVQSGLTSTQLNTTSLSAGMYLVRIANGVNTFALPLTIIR